MRRLVTSAAVLAAASLGLAAPAWAHAELDPGEVKANVPTRIEILLAFALFADDRLEFGRGLSNEDEPDLWRRDYTGDPDLWIDLGQPDESRVRKACNRSREAVVIGYGGQATETWWKKQANALSRQRNLRVIELDSQATEALGALIQRGMRFDVIIQDGEVQMLADHGSVTLTPMVRQAPTE